MQRAFVLAGDVLPCIGAMGDGSVNRLSPSDVADIASALGQGGGRWMRVRDCAVDQARTFAGGCPLD